MRTAVTCLATVCALGCWPSDKSRPTPESATLSLNAVPQTLVLHAGQRHPLSITVSDDRAQPAAGVILRLAIVSDRPDLGRGATLSTSEAVSDSAGQVEVDVRAGLPTTFAVRISAPRAATLEIPVFVGAGTHADLSIVPVTPDAPTDAVASVTVHVYDDDTCASLLRRENGEGNRPPLPSPRQPQIVRPGAEARFANLRTDQTHAALGLGHDAKNVLVARGCVDVPGAQLFDATPARTYLPVLWLPWQASGSYVVESHWTFPARPPAVEALLGHWRACAACPHDPAQWWLDCALDALADSADDPLDCRPSGVENGAVFLAIQARRGLLSQVDARSGCRDALDAQGRRALDARVRDAFRPEAETRIRALPDLADTVEALWRGFSTSSRLDLTASDRLAGGYLAHHSMQALRVQQSASAPPIEIPLKSLGLPALHARHVAAALDGDRLVLGPHAFTLKLGTVLRHAFSVGVLRPRGLAENIAALVRTITEGLESDVGGMRLSGCPALDALVCRDVGLDDGCLEEACARATEVWAGLLSDGFAAFDGDDRDLFLEGEGAAGGLPRTRTVSTFGITSDMGTTGHWNTLLRTRSGNHVLMGAWGARRYEPVP